MITITSLRRVAVVAGCVAATILAPSDVIAGGEPLFIYCCAGFRPPIEEAARIFSESHQVRVEVTYAGSGCLIAQAELAGRGDLFIPGEEHYIVQAQERGLVGEVSRIAYLRPVIAVRKGNPLGIHGLTDLARPSIRLGLGDPKSVAVGLAAEGWLDAALSEQAIAAVHGNTITRAINVNELGNQIVLGGLDAAIVWDVTVRLFPDLDAIVPAVSRDPRTGSTGSVLEMSPLPDLADAFLEFLTGDAGSAILVSHGYEPFGAASVGMTEPSIPEVQSKRADGCGPPDHSEQVDACGQPALSVRADPSAAPVSCTSPGDRSLEERP